MSVYKYKDTNLSDLFASGGHTTSTTNFRVNDSSTGLQFLEGGTSSTVKNQSNNFIDYQNNTGLKNNNVDIGNNFCPYYLDITANVTNQSVPSWCDYIVAFALGGGGYVGYGRNTDDQKHTSGSGGGGGFIAWKSPTDLGSTGCTYSVVVAGGTGRNPGAGGGTSYVTIRNSSGGGIGYCWGYGGGASQSVNGDDDDETHHNTRAGGGGGSSNAAGGEILRQYTGPQGGWGGGAVWDGQTNAATTQGDRVHTWGSNYGRGGYWGTFSNTGGVGNGGNDGDDGLNGHGPGHDERIKPGEPGIVRLYFFS